MGAARKGQHTRPPRHNAHAQRAWQAGGRQNAHTLPWTRDRYGLLRTDGLYEQIKEPTCVLHVCSACSMLQEQHERTQLQPVAPSSVRA